jgi:DNA-binding transcriptional LysR family regulator
MPPTAAGRTLLALASPLIEGVESLESAFRDACDRRQAKLRLGASPRTLAEDLPDFLVAFTEEQPGIQLAVHKVRDSDIIDLLAARRLDLGLSALRGDSSQMPPGLQIEPVFDLDLLLLVPLRHRLARQQKVRLETLPFAELLNDLDLFPSDSVSARLRELAAAGEAKRRFRLTGADTIRRYVRRGMGIGVIGGLPGRKPDRTLVEIPLGEHFGPLAVQAVYRENALNQGALQITVKALRDWVKGEGWQAISSEL